MIAAQDFASLREVMQDLDPPDAADIVMDLPAEDKAVIFRILPRVQAAHVFEYLPLEEQENLLRAMSEKQAADILNCMSPDDRTALLEELPAQATRRMLELLSPEELETAKKLLGYPEESVGRRMTPNYVAVQPNWTLQQVLDHIRAYGRRSETLNVIYVVDSSGTLLDDITIGKILMAPLDSKVEALMGSTVRALMATDDQETAIAAFKKYDRSALPVTDSEGMLVGIITGDDVLDVATNEATEDIQKIGGMEALDEPYMTTPFQRMIKKRATWLVVLFLGEMLTATAMAFFEDELKKAVVLMLFVPLIISSGGNSGSQASTLVIRALSLGEIRLRDWWRVMKREILSGLALGSLLGAIGFARIAVWSTFSTIYGPHWLLVAITIFFTLIGVVLWGTLSGSMLPLVLRRVGLDPAVSSAPFVATMVDVTGLVIYFSVALVILHGTLL
ncbi:MAG: magnesium transporter [Candidatus Sumerlaeaceae bacterium]|nr:magnesium transporter [Candidatus Sumerlaeaceae bacterium]